MNMHSSVAECVIPEFHAAPPWRRPRCFRAYRTDGGANPEHGGMSAMSPNLYLRASFRTVLFLFLVAGAALAPASARGEKKPKGDNLTPLDVRPQLLNVRTNPTLRYPVMSESGWSVKSLSYGWFDISRNSVRYSVVEPSKKANEGFDIPRGEIGEVSVNYKYWTILNFRPLQEKRRGARKYYLFAYVPQDRWGKVHTAAGLQKFFGAWTAGTESMGSAMSNLDEAVDVLVDVPVREGDLARVNALLADAPELLSRRDMAGETPLHVAAAAGQEEMAKLLVEKGAEVSAKDNAGDTPLHVAAAAGQEEMAKLLVEKGADVSAKDNVGGTPLYLARNHVDFAELLCKHLASCRQISDAADKGELELAEGLLKADPNLVFGRDDRGRTPLHHAACGGHRDLVEQILAKAAEVNATDSDGATPLHLAAAGGHEDVARLLIAHGGDAIARSGDGSTPSALAAKNGRTEVAEFLRQQEPGAAAQAINAAAALLGTTSTGMLGNRVSGGAQGFLVDGQHPARLRLVAPVLPMADNLPVVQVFIQVYSGKQPKVDIAGDLRGNWEMSGNGQLLFAGGAGSDGKWYLNEGEFQFRGGVTVARHLIVFTNGEIVSTSQWGGRCTEGTVAKVDGVDYELNGQGWKAKN
jgi:ankyrin repeat protein